MPNKIVLSTDIGTDIDDALALHIALLHPDIQLEGVYTTNGDVVARAKIAKRLMELLKHETPVAIGEAEPLSGEVPPYSTGYEQRFVPDEYKDKQPKELGIIEDGVSDLDSRVNSGDITIASIAPLTNIAKLVERTNMDNKVYIMGGRQNYPEHNFRHDIEAARKVIESDLNLVIVPADLCGRYKMPLDGLMHLQSPSGQYIKEMLNAWMIYRTGRDLVGSGFTQDHARVKANLNQFPEVNGLVEVLQYPSFVVKYPEEFYQTFDAFLNILKKGTKNPFIGELYLKAVDSIPSDVAVHDAYAIYAIAHPERIKTIKGQVTIGKHGEMTVSKGNKHTLVTDLDFEHFKGFLRTYLK